MPQSAPLDKIRRDVGRVGQGVANADDCGEAGDEGGIES
jgi:hypothetical protein